MTTVSYKGYRLERNTTGMWVGLGADGRFGPYSSVEVLRMAIDRHVPTPVTTYPILGVIAGFVVLAVVAVGAWALYGFAVSRW